LADTPAVAPAVTGADFYTPPANVGVYANGAIIKYEDSAVAISACRPSGSCTAATMSTTTR